MRFVILLLFFAFLCSSRLHHIFILFSPHRLANLLLRVHHRPVLVNLLLRWRFLLIFSHLLCSLKCRNWFFLDSIPAKTWERSAFFLIESLDYRCWTESNSSIFKSLFRPILLHSNFSSIRVKISFKNWLVLYLLHFYVSGVYKILAPVILVHQGIILLWTVGAVVFVTILLLEIILLAKRGLIRTCVARKPPNIGTLLTRWLLHVAFQILFVFGGLGLHGLLLRFLFVRKAASLFSRDLLCRVLIFGWVRWNFIVLWMFLRASLMQDYGCIVFKSQRCLMLAL